MSLHPVLAVSLAGSSLVEASAGTGKTWTIVGLYLRLVIEVGLEPKNILAVTFTKTATAELSGRIRRELVALDAALNSAAAPLAVPPLAAPSSLVQMLWPLVEQLGQVAVRAQVRLALASFDEAVIVTIHAFCQRALGDAAFESARPFSEQALISDAPLLREAAEDKWRKLIATSPQRLLRFLIDQNWGPGTLLERARPLLGARPAVAMAAPTPATVLDEAALQCAYDAARALWQSDGEDICQRANDNKLLTVTTRRVAQRVLNDYFSSAEVRLDMDAVSIAGEKVFALGRFVPAYMPKKSAAVVDQPFYKLAETLLASIERATAALYDLARSCVIEFADEAQRHLADRKADSGALSFDDMLTRVAASLRAPTGPALAARLANQYAAALVDEFQDTDRLQFQIFTDVFVRHGQPLVLVGDPKQAIYSFRGADIFTYLAARNQIDAVARFELAVNRRSSPPLVAALNAIFNRPNAFVFEAIEFAQALPLPGSANGILDSGDSDESGASDDNDAAVRVWWAEPDEVDRGDQVTACADEIAHLLQRAARGRLRISINGGSRPLIGRDIAVIVGTHHELERVRTALAVRGIASVTRSRQSVYASPEATDLVRILDAFASPTHAGAVKAALTTRVFGLHWQGLATTALDDDRWQRHGAEFQQLAALYQRFGLMRAWRELTLRYQLGALVTARYDGARIVTNYEHIVELAHMHARAHDLSPRALARYIERAASDCALDADSSSPDDDPALLRLESDADLVQILTVHQCKGLEFPVVFCPFLASGERQRAKRAPPAFHQSGSDTVYVDLTVPPDHASTARAALESMAERVRLAYVAMTRAQLRLYVWWGALRGRGDSALAWLWHRDTAITEPLASMIALRTKFTRPDSALLRAEMERIAIQSTGTIKIVDVRALNALNALNALSALSASSASSDLYTARNTSPSVASLPDNVIDGVDPTVNGTARVFTRGRLAPRPMTSFSAIANAAHVSDVADHDAFAVSGGAVAAVMVDEVKPQQTLNSLPRGAQTGSAIHKLFELLIAQPASRAAIERYALEVLPSFGLSRNGAPEAARWIMSTLDATLDAHGMRLRDVDPTRCNVELEFTLPLAQVDRGRLAALLQRHRAQAQLPPLEPGRVDIALAPGFMKGFVDLVFEHGGQYFIVDYKTNDLGQSGSDYSSAKLAVAIAADLYDLQYLLYCVALRRLLRWRTQQRNASGFGGVLYLFIRGIAAADSTNHQDRPGVYFARPEDHLLDQLDALFDVPPEGDA